MHVHLFAHVMDRMLTVAIEDYKQYHLEFHEMFLNCKYSIS
jgi:hypothetical protein